MKGLRDDGHPRQFARNPTPHRIALPRFDTCRKVQVASLGAPLNGV